jgi:hypothetical protein
MFDFSNDGKGTDYSGPSEDWLAAVEGKIDEAMLLGQGHVEGEAE